MKSLITSVLLFSVMAGGLLWNSLYLARVSDELTACIEEIPPYTEEESTAAEEKRLDGISDLSALWEKHQGILSLSVTVRITEGFEDTLGKMTAAFHHGDLTEFDAAREHLLRIVEDLQRYDGITLGSIL